MAFIINEIDNGPEELIAQLSFSCRLLRPIPGSNRQDYWLAQMTPPIRCADTESKEIRHVIAVPRLVGHQIRPGVGRILLALAHVINESLLQDERMNFAKSAICIAQEK